MRYMSQDGGGSGGAIVNVASMAGLFVRSFILSFFRSCVPSFERVCLFVRSFVRSFVPVFVFVCRFVLNLERSFIKPAFCEHLFHPN